MNKKLYLYQYISLFYSILFYSISRDRPLFYQDATLFWICFSVVDPPSFEQVLARWVPEVRYHCPYVPIVLVGTKSDLREDPQILQSLSER